MPTFFVIPGDYSHLDGVFIGAYKEDNDYSLIEELSNLLFDPDTGELIQERLEEFPVDTIRYSQEDMVKVIRVGMIP